MLEGKKEKKINLQLFLHFICVIILHYGEGTFKLNLCWFKLWTILFYFILKYVCNTICFVDMQKKQKNTHLLAECIPKTTNLSESLLEGQG